MNNLPGVQSVFLSRSSTIEYPKYDPLTDCYVKVVTLDGNRREFRESKPGEYSSNLDEQFIRTGEAYCLVFITPES